MDFECLHNFLGENGGLFKTGTTADAIHKILEKAIIKGILKAGENLPIEGISALFGVSSMPVREAIRELAAKGLVNVVPYKGARVAEVSVKEFKDLADVRLEIEKMALRRAIPMKKERVELLKKIIAQTHDIGNDDEFGFELNDAFHLELYAEVENQVLMDLLKNIRSKMNRYFRLFISSLSSMDQIAREHKLILDGCEAGDIVKAEEALEAHIVGVRDRLAEYLSFVNKDGKLSE